MQDENKTPVSEPQEVVGQYIRDDSREVTDCYVHRDPLPAAAVHHTPQPPKKHSRKGLWIFLAVMAVLVMAAVAAALIAGPEDGGTADDDHDASSIVDIFDKDIPTIDRVEGDPELRFFCTAAEGEALTAQEVYAAVNPSVVMVAVAIDEEKASIGTGVILTEDGYVVTNAHVIAGGLSAWVALDTGEVLDAELVGFDSNEDLALLKLVDGQGLPAARLGDSDACVVGDQVYAIGNPLGVELRGTLTNGLISAIDRQVTMEGRVMTMLQTTAALNNGNSGGPLINDRGQVIGINTMKMSGGKTATATVEGLGFAVPTRRVVAVINDIMATGAFHGIPSLGIYVGQEMQADGAYQLVIYDVTEDYGAAEAGLLPGDVILAADGTEVHETWELLDLRGRHIVGESMVLTVQRGDQVFDADVTLYAAEE
ncbi:MAG: PDZ domain-containing protein [Clostridiales bacterium]|nr:PDZ domain-containing protein [Clostridiales bacterium]